MPFEYKEFISGMADEVMKQEFFLREVGGTQENFYFGVGSDESDVQDEIGEFEENFQEWKHIKMTEIELYEKIEKLLGPSATLEAFAEALKRDDVSEDVISQMTSEEEKTELLTSTTQYLIAAILNKTYKDPESTQHIARSMTGTNRSSDRIYLDVMTVIQERLGW